ncbi:uncharacterized protein LOC143373165 [Andrena cerasifolii]|uniref:uncharacterized protein LOC143373165 n=1 Tax=Andrena cerasifolii TaxID=2819439 RepID=UPI0040384B45
MREGLIRRGADDPWGALALALIVLQRATGRHVCTSQPLGASVYAREGGGEKKRGNLRGEGKRDRNEIRWTNTSGDHGSSQRIGAPCFFTSGSVRVQELVSKKLSTQSLRRQGKLYNYWHPKQKSQLEICVRFCWLKVCV